MPFTASWIIRTMLAFVSVFLRSDESSMSFGKIKALLVL